MTQINEQDSRLKLFFSNPAVGIAGSIASIIGLLLAVYFFWASQAKRELIFYVHPIKATVVRKGEVTNLRILNGVNEINGDVTAAQIAIWNDGNLPIKRENILKPVIIMADPPIPILEVRIRRISRDVTEFAHVSDSLEHGRVYLNWRILEEGDGAIAQLIYAGDTYVKFRVEGVVEGQREITEFEFKGKIRSEEEQYREYGRTDFTSVVIEIGGSMAGIIALLFVLRSSRKVFHRKVLLIPVLVLILLQVGFTFWSYFLRRAPGPPFGF